MSRIGSAKRLLWLCCLLTLVSRAVAADAFREWKDSTGLHTIVAKFVEQRGDSVVLETKDGRHLAIELSRLSEADQKHVASLGADNPFQELKEGPFRELSDEGQPGGMAEPSGPQETNWRAATEIMIVGGNRWEVPEQPGLGFEPQSVPLPKKQHFFEHMETPAINPVCKRAAIGYRITFSVPKPISRLVLADLATGKMVASQPLEANMRPLALLHDGATVVMSGFDDVGEGSEHLQSWRLKGGEVDRGSLWKPYAGDEAKNSGRRPHFGPWAKNDTKIAFAESVGETTLLTCSAAGHLVAWDYPRRQPIWHMRLKREPAIAYSTDRQWMVFSAGNQILVLRTKDGEILGQLSLADKGALASPVFALSPSGRTLAASAGDRLLLLDVQKKEWTADLKLNGLSAGRSFGFPNEDYLLYDGRTLVHWPSRIRLWEYAGAASSQTIGEYGFFGFTSDSGGLLCVMKLPQPQAISMLESARKQSDLFIIRPAAKLALDVSGVSRQYQATVREGLEKAIAKIGCEVAPRAEVTVVAKITGPKQEAVAYHMSGAHVVQRYVSRVALRYADEVVWSTEGTNIPGIVMLSGGETMAQYLAKASKAPNLEFFKRINLPAYLQKPTPAAASGPGRKPGKQMTIGVSTLTANGFH